jgi:hypothetical protein
MLLQEVAAWEVRPCVSELDCLGWTSSDRRHMTVESALLTEWRAATEKDAA